MSLKKIVVAVLVLITVCAGGYKYYEWNSLNALPVQYNSLWKQEFKAVETINKTMNEFNMLVEEISKEETPTAEATNKIIGRTKLIIDQEESYLETLKKNKKHYEALQQQPHLLLGNKKQFTDDVIKLQIEYYDGEITRTTKDLALLYFFHNLFTIQSEGVIIQEFESAAQGNTEYYKEHFGELAVFNKYTEEDYTFSHQEEIKKHYPKVYNLLVKFKTFYATFYEVMEDTVKEDEESAAYKATKLQEQAVDLNVDPNEIVKSGLEEQRKIVKDSIVTIAKQIRLIKDYEANGMPRYPLLPELQQYEEDLVLCQLYASKTGAIYYDVMNEYPEAKNTDGLLKDLSTVSPKTDEIDKLFDKSALNFSNNEKKIAFTCADKNNENKYLFETTKQ